MITQHSTRLQRRAAQLTAEPLTPQAKAVLTQVFDRFPLTPLAVAFKFHQARYSSIPRYYHSVLEVFPATTISIQVFPATTICTTIPVKASLAI